jgi:hypothetical protein
MHGFKGKLLFDELECFAQNSYSDRNCTRDIPNRNPERADSRAMRVGKVKPWRFGRSSGSLKWLVLPAGELSLAARSISLGIEGVVEARR